MEMNEEKRFLDVHDVMEITGLSSSSSYIVIKQLNEELRKKGYLTIRAKVISTYFYERFFGKEVHTNARIQR
ncbi:DNA-binding protein [[Clostridium] innocuum]|nr:DNA-binding protein [[Clostridium] innocuum]